jgi:hypothetical protein
MSSGATPADRKVSSHGQFEVWALAVFVIATAGIDEDGQPILADQETLNADDQISANRVLKTRHEPSTVLIEMRLRAVAEKL